MFDGWRVIAPLELALDAFPASAPPCTRLVSPDGSTTAILGPDGRLIERRAARAEESSAAATAVQVNRDLGDAQRAARQRLLELTVASAYPAEWAALHAATSAAGVDLAIAHLPL